MVGKGIYIVCIERMFIADEGCISSPEPDEIPIQGAIQIKQLFAIPFLSLT